MTANCLLYTRTLNIFVTCWKVKFFSIFTDQKPLVYAFSKKLDSTTPKQVWQLNFIRQFSTSIHHISRKNIISDALLRLCTTECPESTDYHSFSLHQAEDAELKQFLNNPTTSSLILKQIDVSNTDIIICCDINQPKARSFIPASGRMSIFKKFHNIVHPGVRTT